MAGLLDFLPPMTVDATNPPTQVMSPQMLGLLGAAAGAAPYMGYSRLPVSGSQILAGMAGGYGRGYLSGLQGIGQAQQNELTGAKTNLYRDLLPTLQGLMGGAPAASPGQSAPPPRPIQTSFGMVAPTPENAQNIGGFMSGQGFPASAPAGPSGPPVAASPSTAVANAQRVAMLGGFLGMPGLGSAAEMGLKYSPAVQSQIEAAKANVSSPLAVDLANEKSARDVGNIDAANAWHLKALQDSGAVQVARNSGIVTTLNPDATVRSYVNPEQGSQYSGGVLSLIPGALSSLGQKAFAQGGGESAGRLLNEPIATQVPSGPRAGQQQTQLGGQLFPIQVPGMGTINAPRAASPAAPSAAPALPGVTTKVAPSVEEISKGAGEQATKTNEAYQAELDSAQKQNAQIDTIRNAAATFGPGKFANWRGQWLNWMNSANLISDADLKKLGSYQEGTKVAIQLQAAATKTLGSREAAQIFQWMGKSMPNLELSTNGLEKVSSFMQGMNDFQAARAQEAQKRFNQNDVPGVNSTRDDFYKNSNPMFFIMSASSPADRAEYLQNMGKEKATKFVQSWQAARNAGFAP